MQCPKSQMRWMLLFWFIQAQPYTAFPKCYWQTCGHSSHSPKCIPDTSTKGLDKTVCTISWCKIDGRWRTNLTYSRDTHERVCHSRPSLSITLISLTCRFSSWGDSWSVCSHAWTRGNRKWLVTERRGSCKETFCWQSKVPQFHLSLSTGILYHPKNMKMLTLLTNGNHITKNLKKKE